MCDDSIVSEKLRELVLDENKIVTYKYLSKICSIHVNFAKRALEQFLNSDGTLNATYFLSGFIKQENDPDTAGYQVAVVPGEKVEKAKCTFSKLDSCHVYSIQKSTIKDSSILYSANNVNLENSGSGRPTPVIHNENLSKSGRKPQVAKHIPPSQLSKPSPKESVKKSAVSPDDSPKDEKTITESVKPVDKPVDNKSTAKGKGSQKSQKAGIMAAFARGEATKKKSPVSVAKEDVKPSETVVKKEPAANGLTRAEKSDVSSEKKRKRQNGSIGTKKDLKRIEKQMWSSSESSSEDEVTPPKRSKTLNRIKQLPESDSDDEPMEVKTELKEVKTELKEGKKEPKEVKKELKEVKKELKEVKKELKEVKKEPKEMKKESKKVKKEPEPEEPIPSRVHTLSDDDDEDVIPPTPDEDRTSRQYVSVTNTYEDENGFLVTRKERQLEEVPLPESPVLSKKAVKKSPPPKKNSERGKSKSVQDNGKKQASLMSFFTKK